MAGLILPDDAWRILNGGRSGSGLAGAEEAAGRCASGVFSPDLDSGGGLRCRVLETGAICRRRMDEARGGLA